MIINLISWWKRLLKNISIYCSISETPPLGTYVSKSYGNVHQLYCIALGKKFKSLYSTLEISYTYWYFIFYSKVMCYQKSWYRIIYYVKLNFKCYNLFKYEELKSKFLNYSYCKTTDSPNLKLVCIWKSFKHDNTQMENVKKNNITRFRWYTTFFVYDFNFDFW